MCLSVAALPLRVRRNQSFSSGRGLDSPMCSALPDDQNQSRPRSKVRFALGDPDSPERLRLTEEHGEAVVYLRPGWNLDDHTTVAVLNQLFGVDD